MGMGANSYVQVPVSLNPHSHLIHLVPTKKLVTFKSQLLGYKGTATIAITFTWNICYNNKITSQKLLPVYCCLLSPDPRVFTCQHRRPFVGKGVCKRKGLLKKIKMLTVAGLSPSAVQPRNESRKQQRFRLVMMSAILGTVFILEEKCQTR